MVYGRPKPKAQKEFSSSNSSSAQAFPNFESIESRMITKRRKQGAPSWSNLASIAAYEKIEKLTSYSQVHMRTHTHCSEKEWHVTRVVVNLES